jgi:hypothetical protein
MAHIKLDLPDPLVLKDNVSTFAPTFKNEYPKKRATEIQAIMARSLPQILNLWETLSNLRRVPPGTAKDYGAWQESMFITDEAGVLMRVAQTSLITKAEVIPNVNETLTYVVDSGMSFKSLKNSYDKVFVTNFEITVHIPFSEEIDIHCFETNCSVLLKWDTCFKFKKVIGNNKEGVYKVCLPGFHALDDKCVNRLNLVFTANLPKHLPINVLLAYDYVFLRYELSRTVYDILHRHKCVRVNGRLGLKTIPREPNTRPELFVITDEVKIGDNLVFGKDGIDSIRHLFSATKFKENLDDHHWSYRHRLDEFEKDFCVSFTEENRKLQPENGTPDICGISYMFSDKEIQAPLRIIIMCLRLMKPRDYAVIEKLPVIPEDLLKEVRKIARLVIEDEIRLELSVVFSSGPYAGFSEDVEPPAPITMDSREFMNILEKNVYDVIDKLNVPDKDKLRQGVQHFLQQYNAMGGANTFSRNKERLLYRIINNRIDDVKKTVYMVKQPEKFWNLDKFDTVFSENYNDDFGIGPSYGHCRMHFN